MSSTIILGGGFGGLACARALRARLGPGHAITVIDRSPVFVVGASKTWVMLGERKPEEVQAYRARLLPEDVELRQEEVLSIHPDRREVRTRAGSYSADHLVVALGAEPDWSQVKGLPEAGHTFYTLEGADRLHQALLGFPGGRLALLIPRTPFPCPPGPYEAAFLLHASLERRGLRAKTELEIWTVERAPMATAGPEMGRMITSELSVREIAFHPGKKASSVDPVSRIVRFEDGSESRPADLLIAVPPFRTPPCVVASGLAEPGGWVPVDPKTLEVRSSGAPGGVYATGDVTSVALPGRYDPSAPLALPKAGVMAAAQGEIVADAIASSVQGVERGRSFDGKGYCYIELGDGQAMRADGDFYAMPHPVMRPSPPDESQYREKLAWVSDWLRAPEGSPRA